MHKEYDVIVVGAGHAGCEAGLAAARMGCTTAMMTLSIDSIALPPCNPSIGGTAKGQVVREVDALGGEMGKNIDETFIQIRLLNDSKGPAVQALRAQMDRNIYMERMRRVVQTQDNLELKQGLVTEVIVRDTPSGKEIAGVRTSLGQEYHAKTVILTTGTSLDSKIIIGDKVYSGGRNGEMPAIDLSKSLKAHGFSIARWKTGTPPRLSARSIDWSQLEIQPGSTEPLAFGHYYDDASRQRRADNYAKRFPRGFIEGSMWGRWLQEHYPQELANWQPQVPCFLTYTNEATHQLVRDNLHRAPMFNGVIEGTGPRYCPSFEAKVANFPDKDSHHFFLEPEGWDNDEIYIQGANTSLPEDVQLAMVRTLPGLQNAEMMRVGYAIEYDGISTNQLLASLETKLIKNLFLAGQINGTSGYEEAAGQGIVAGINAARAVKGQEAMVLKRSDAYIGVMIDDLINKDIDEPYRLMTSRSEYRLILRTDNADLRLSEMGRAAGLLGDAQYAGFAQYRDTLASAKERLGAAKLKMTPELNARLTAIDPGLELKETLSAADFLRRTKADMDLIAELLPQFADIAPMVRRELEIQVKYDGYIKRQEELVERFNTLEEKLIPEDFDYTAINGLSTEAREKLQRFRPHSLGQAGRISGVNPADVAVLMAWMKKAG
jgi:tRNA uridine 5-carboxymethylaminomethyl modification enzyme